MIAAVKAVQTWGHGDTVIFVDNTVAESWLNGPESQEQYGLHLGNTRFLESQRVASRDNPADGISRGESTVSEEDHQKARRLVARWKSRPQPWYDEEEFKTPKRLREEDGTPGV